MAKPVSKTLIGAFVLGALALIFVGFLMTGLLKGIDFDDVEGWSLSDNPYPHTAGGRSAPDGTRAAAINVLDRLQVSAIGWEVRAGGGYPADATLAGIITTFSASPSGFSRSGSADHYTIYLVAGITLTETRTKRVVYTNPSYAFNEDYEVPEGRDFESVQTEALKKVAEKFARNLVVSILEGF